MRCDLGLVQQNINLSRKGAETRFLPMPQVVDEVVDGAFFERHLGERTRTVPMSLVAFHAGHPFDVESVGRLCRERGIFFVVDVMQGIGVVLVDVKKIGVPFVGSGTRKGLLLPQGLGFLDWNCEVVDARPSYMAAITRENPPADLIARHDNMVIASTARRFEIGNFNLPAVPGLGGALELLEGIGVAEIQEQEGFRP